MYELKGSYKYPINRFLTKIQFWTDKPLLFVEINVRGEKYGEITCSYHKIMRTYHPRPGTVGDILSVGKKI